MNEGVPVRTIATMVIATVIAAAIVGLLLIRFFAPPAYVYHAAREARAERPLSAAILQTQSVFVTSIVAATV